MVKVEICLINDWGAYVRLLEYGGIEGFIDYNNVFKRRYRSIHKVLKIGRRYMMEVSNVDEETNYIDLCKKYLMPDSNEQATKRWKKSKKVH